MEIQSGLISLIGSDKRRTGGGEEKTDRWTDGQTEGNDEANGAFFA